MISLFLILVLVYVAQASQLFKGRPSIFRRSLSGKWKALEPVVLPGIGRSLYWGMLLPPLRGLLVSAEACNGNLDKRSIEQRLQEYESATQWTRPLADFLFFFLVVFVPVVFIVLPVSQTWRILLCELVLLQVSAAIVFYSAHSRLYPDRRDERFGHTLTVLLSPIAALRVDDVLLRTVLTEYHPVAVARVLLGEEEALHFVSRYLWIERHGQDTRDIDGLSLLESFVQREFGQKTFIAQRKSPDAISFCPICGAEYRSVVSQCSSCGTPVLIFDEPRGE